MGNASDLAAEVRCSSSNDNTSNVSWLYENGTAVSSGLRAFGTTQGDGVLRVYPATMLSGGNGTRFWCLDAENNDKLRVTLVLRKSPCTIKIAHCMLHNIIYCLAPATSIAYKSDIQVLHINTIIVVSR